ncbi:MAG: hypothetical protein ACT4PK_09675 [Gammaproteobacteria bacterium]
MAFRLNLASALALAVLAGPAQANSIADLGLSLEQVRALNAQLTAPIAAPGVTFGAPTAFGAGWGQAFAGLGGRTLSEGSSQDPDQDLDGSALVGFGMGDPRVLGLEIAMNIVSLSDGFAQDGSWGFKLHHSFPFRAAIAFGVDDGSGWGDAGDTHSSAYAAYSQVIDLAGDSPKRPLSLAFGLGAGKQRFAEPGKENDFAPFGSVALNWHRQASAIADWHSGDLHLALSVVPLYRLPLVATLGFINVTERFESSDFAAGVGYLYQF